MINQLEKYAKVITNHFTDCDVITPTNVGLRKESHAFYVGILGTASSCFSMSDRIIVFKFRGHSI